MADDALNSESDIRAQSRDAFIVVPLDGQHRATEVCALIRSGAATYQLICLG